MAGQSGPPRRDGGRPDERSTVRWIALLAIAGGSSVLWFFGVTRWAWLPLHFATPHLDLPKILGVSQASLESFVALALLQLALYAAALWLVRPFRDPRAVVAVLLLALLPALPLLFTYPVGAGDVYAYIAEADLVLRYQVSPFEVPVGSIPDHPLLPFLDYPGETTHYGPLWLVLTVALRFLSGPDLLLGLLVFKVAALAFLLITAWLSYLTLRRDDASAAMVAATAVAWNPLLIFELAGNAHNDVAMVALIALAFYLQNRGSRRGAIAALLGASLIKYVAVILLPLFLLVNLRGAGPWPRWLGRAVLDAVGVALLGAAVLLVVGFDGTVGILQKMTEWFTTSVGAAAYYWLVQRVPQDEASQAVSNAAKYGFVALYSAGLPWLWLRRARLSSVSLWAVLAFMAVATVWFQPWYVTWALPLAALAGRRIGIGALLGMTAGGFGIHTVMGFGWRLEWYKGDLAGMHAAGAASMWVPVLLGITIALALALAHSRMSPASSVHRVSEGASEPVDPRH